MIPGLRSTADIAKLRSQDALCVLRPTRISPRWERAIAGSPVGEFDTRNLSGWQKVLTWRSGQIHYNANVREPQYMVQLLRGFVGILGMPVNLDLLVDAKSATRLPSDAHEWFRHVWVTHNESFRNCLDEKPISLRSRTYDTLIFLYPDSTGLGWRAVERNLRTLKVRQTLVINGRGRIFLYDRQTRNALLWRRIIERSRIVESAMALAFLAAALPLAAWDVISTRDPRP